MQSLSIHIDILIWTSSSIIEACQEPSFMQHHRNSIDIKYITRNIGASAKRTNFQCIHSSILIKFDFEEIIIKITV